MHSLLRLIALQCIKSSTTLMSDVTKGLATTGCVHHLLTEAFMAEDMHQNQSTSDLDLDESSNYTSPFNLDFLRS